ncbi:MAG: hypothetical protein ACE5JX_06945 [Acidobacteriota bacterium]
MTNDLNDLTFSETHSKKRLAKACQILGRSVVLRIIGFALFLQGAKREDIAQRLKIPVGTFLSLLTRIHRTGFDAFQDQRSARVSSPPPVHGKQKTSLRKEYDWICVDFGDERSIRMPVKDSHQCRVVLLNLLESGLLSSSQVSQALGISARQTRWLHKKFKEQGALSIVDQRRGQRKEYRFTPEVKAEMIQQFVLNVLTGKSASGQQLALELRRRCELELAPRTIRLHLGKLGLPEIKGSLPALIEEVKKTPESAG